jgi:outer membrane protein, heavy metal efflux system
MFSLFFILLHSWAAPSTQLSIDQLLERAVQNSLQVQIQSYKVEETRSLGSAQTAWSNPNVTLESQKGDDNTGMPINKYQVSVIQPLTSPWRTRLKSKIAKSSLDIENHHLEDQKLATKIETLQLIFHFNIACEKAKRVDAHVKRIELLHSFLRSRKFVSPQKQSEAFIVENKIKVLRKQLDDLNVLKQGLWLRLNTLLQLETPMQLQPFWVNQALEISKDEYLQKTLTYNHDLELSQFEIEKSQSELSYEKNQRLPDIALTGGAGKGQSGNPEDNYTIGLQVSVPLFNINRNKLKSSQWSLKQSQTRKELVVQQLKRDFQDIYNQYMLSKDLIQKFPLTKLSQMENSMKKMTEQFKRGQVDLITFVEADLSHDQLIDETLNIQMNYIQSLSHMSMLVGEMIPLQGVIHEIRL